MQSQTRLRNLMLAVVLVASAACSLGGEPAGPRQPPTAALTSLVTPTAAGSPAPAALGAKREIAPLYVQMKSGKPTGGVGKALVSVEKNPGKEMKVGFFEEEVAGSGPMWKASGWLAVIMSGMIIGDDPTTYRYSFEVSGYSDGPSAGALLTVATLAAIKGTNLKSEVTMTGTINPDGTIGPVGGIPHKVDGAAKAGKKVVLIPLGQRKARDLEKKQDVDVVELGKKQGVEVREVGDIYEAYTALTGAKLPRPEAGADNPSLTAADLDKTKAKLKEWRARYDDQRAQFGKLPEKLQDDKYVKEVMARAAKEAEAAAAAEKDGLFGAAYLAMVSATGMATGIVQSAKVFTAYQAGDMLQAREQLRAIRPKLKIDQLLEDIDKRMPATMSDVVAMSNSHAYLAMAMGMQEWGDSIAEMEPSKSSTAVVQILTAAYFYSSAVQWTLASRDALEMGMNRGKGTPPSRESLQKMADMFRRAAEANLNYFDQVVLAEVAQEAGTSIDEMRALFGFYEPFYQTSRSLALAMQPIEKRSRSDTAKNLAMLGGGMNSYVYSSLLVARYYSLNARVGKDGVITTVAAEPMQKMLEFAETRARENMHAASAAGVDAPILTVNYQYGRLKKGGSPDDKLRALGGYWTAGIEGQMIAALAKAPKE